MSVNREPRSEGFRDDMREFSLHEITCPNCGTEMKVRKDWKITRKYQCPKCDFRVDVQTKNNENMILIALYGFMFGAILTLIIIELPRWLFPH